MGFFSQYVFYDFFQVTWLKNDHKIFEYINGRNPPYRNFTIPGGVIDVSSEYLRFLRIRESQENSPSFSGSSRMSTNLLFEVWTLKLLASTPVKCQLTRQSSPRTRMWSWFTWYVSRRHLSYLITIITYHAFYSPSPSAPKCPTQDLLQQTAVLHRREPSGQLHHLQGTSSAPHNMADKRQKGKGHPPNDGNPPQYPIQVKTIGDVIYSVLSS